MGCVVPDEFVGPGSPDFEEILSAEFIMNT